MSDLNQELRALLLENGAAMVGFADLSGVVNDDMTFGISVVINISKDVIRSIHDDPNMTYYDEYHRLNDKLNFLVNLGADYLKANGYKAFAQTTDTVKQFDMYRTTLPHKTVATIAGLGWIGKSALFVTREFGPAVRISSLVTNAKLTGGNPITSSECGDCMACTEACPGHAVSGKLWHKNMDRDEFFDSIACRQKARELSAEKIHKEITLCGKCFEVCPYTKKYLDSVE